MSQCASSTMLLVVLLPFSLATGLLHTLLSSNITKAVYPTSAVVGCCGLGFFDKSRNKAQQGAALGVSSSIGGLARIFTPVVGGYLFDQAGYPPPYPPFFSRKCRISLIFSRYWVPGALGAVIAFGMVLFCKTRQTYLLKEAA